MNEHDFEKQLKADGFNEIEHQAPRLIAPISLTVVRSTSSHHGLSN